MIDDLQISSEARRLILALSQNYAFLPSKPQSNDNRIYDRQAPWSSDFIANKGRGQILLLHGKPGVGKFWSFPHLTSPICPVFSLHYRGCHAQGC